MSKAEQAVVQAVDVRADVDEAARTLSPILERTPEALRKAIRDARQRLIDKSSMYVELHEQAALKAAKRGDARPAQWALEHIAEGTERIVQPAPTAAPVNVGVQVVLPSFAAPTSQNAPLLAPAQNTHLDPVIEGESVVVGCAPVRSDSETGS